MRWHPLDRFDRPNIGKLFRLRVAARLEFDVPETVWSTWSDAPSDADLSAVQVPFSVPCIVRSAAADEDGHGTSAAGQYDSVEVPDVEPGAFRDAVRRVLSSMGGAGTVFVQPLVAAERAGVVFFDDFHFERTEAAGSNRTLTSGTERGDVLRGDVQPGDAFSTWLKALGRAFRDDLREAGALDAEYAVVDGRRVLLQLRPALFGVRRNPVLSLANHREILGNHPSPWIVDALVRAGEQSVDAFARIDPAVGTWDGHYAEAHAGRAWLNISFFFRLMDHWGLPRSMVTEGIGGTEPTPEERRGSVRAMLRASPRLARLQWDNVRTMRRIDPSLAAYDRVLEGCDDLSSCFEATVVGLDLALRTNFAINGALSGISRMRRAIGVRGRARVVTEEMMEEYDALRRRPRDQREGALDAWIARFGHRGPLESDPVQPRFAELRDTLAQDVLAAPDVAAEAEAPTRSKGSGGPLYAVDRTRERFRDELMRRWQRLREVILRVAREAVQQGTLKRVDDAFLLGERSRQPPDTWLAAVEQVRARRENEAHLNLPNTARRDEIRAAVEASNDGPPSDSVQDAWRTRGLRGIGLGTSCLRGRVVRARDLPTFLAEESMAARLGPETILVVPALEPSWAVIFPRVGGVVTEIGGELSHASILLREAGKPALVNCAGVFEAVEDGEWVQLDERAGRLLRVDPPRPREGDEPRLG